MDWRPQPKQEQFLLSLADDCLFGGAKGPGKSDALLVESTRQTDNQRYKGIIFRRTYPKLEELIGRSHNLFFKMAKWSGKTYSWTWPSGATVRFMHCKNEEDKYNIQGHEYQFIGIDQLEEFTQTQVDFIKLQNRTSVPDLHCYFRATANPCGIGHMWVKQRYIDKCPPDGSIKFFKKVFDPVSGTEIEIECDKNDPKALSRSFIFATVRDNSILLAADPGYVRRLEAIPDPNLRRALLDGDWDAFQGQFFSEWRRDVHVMQQQSYYKLTDDLPVSRFIAMDYGFRKPSSVGWYAVFPDEKIVRYRELYKEGYTYEELAFRILEMTPHEEKIDYIVSDPAILGDKSHHTEKDGEVAGKSGLEVMRGVMAGRIPVLTGDNRRVVGWGRVRDCLKPYKDQHGEITASFRVTDRCMNLIRTLPSMIYDATKMEDMDTDGEDHACDEVRYALMSRPNVPPPRQEPVTLAQDFWNRVKKDLRKERESDESDLMDLEDGEEIISE